MLQHPWLCHTVLCANNVQLELAGVFLELFSRGDASSGKPVHSFHLDVGVTKGLLKIILEVGECSKQLVGKPLLVVDFSPGSG